MSQHKAAARVQGDRAVYAPRLENAAAHRRTAAPRRTLYYVRDVSQRYEKLALKRTDGTTQSNATQGGGGAAALNRPDMPSWLLLPFRYWQIQGTAD